MWVTDVLSCLNLRQKECNKTLSLSRILHMYNLTRHCYVDNTLYNECLSVISIKAELCFSEENVYNIVTPTKKTSNKYYIMSGLHNNDTC